MTQWIGKHFAASLCHASHCYLNLNLKKELYGFTLFCDNVTITTNNNKKVQGELYVLFCGEKNNATK